MSVPRVILFSLVDTLLSLFFPGLASGPQGNRQAPLPAAIAALKRHSPAFPTPSPSLPTSISIDRTMGVTPQVGLTLTAGAAAGAGVGGIPVAAMCRQLAPQDMTILRP